MIITHPRNDPRRAKKPSTLAALTRIVFALIGMWLVISCLFSVLHGDYSRATFELMAGMWLIGVFDR